MASVSCLQFLHHVVLVVDIIYLLDADSAPAVLLRLLADGPNLALLGLQLIRNRVLLPLSPLQLGLQIQYLSVPAVFYFLDL